MNPESIKQHLDPGLDRDQLALVKMGLGGVGVTAGVSMIANSTPTVGVVLVLAGVLVFRDGRTRSNSRETRQAKLDEYTWKGDLDD